MRAEGKLEQAIKDQTGKSFNVRRRAMWDQIEPLLSINQSAWASDTLIIKFSRNQGFYSSILNCI